MKYAIEMGSGGMIYIPSLINIGSGFEKLTKGNSQTRRQHGDHKSLCLVLQNKECGLKTIVRKSIRQREFWVLFSS
jgi:hypothetical protein